MQKIMVLFGGKSVEHDVSVISGLMCVNSLNREKYQVLPVYIARNGEWYLPKRWDNICLFKNPNLRKMKRVSLVGGEPYLCILKGKRIQNKIKVDCAINCTHGYNGEDGTLSGAVASSYIPFASPDAFCSGLSMDKERTKIFLKGIGADCLKYKVCVKSEYVNNPQGAISKIEKLKYPVIIKPANLGSSIGISVCTGQEELKKGLDKAFLYDEKAVCEPALRDFTEINCAAVMLDNEIVVSECEKPERSGSILSFEDKYKRGGGREFPANIDKETCLKIKDLTKKIYLKGGFKGIIRVDYIVKEGVFVNEINAVPGCLAYYLFCETFSAFSKMLDKIIEQSQADFKEYDSKQFAFEGNILNLEYKNNIKK